jgi:hypothetical protein
MEEQTKINPWVSIWLRSKITIRSILQTNPTRGFFWLAIIAGFQQTIMLMNVYPVGFAKHIFMFFIALIISPIVGYIWFYYFGGIIYLISKWFGGAGTYGETRTAYAWSRLPVSIYLILLTMLLFVKPELIFSKYLFFSSSVFVAIVGLVFGIWALIILFQNLTEVHKYTPVKTILTMIFSYLVNFIIVIIISYIVSVILLKMNTPV